MGDKQFIIDLSNKNFSGDILDISYEGCSVIPNFIDEKFNKDFYSVNDLPSNIGKFDKVVFFLSINKWKARAVKKVLRELKSSLKNNATIMIWDINYRKISVFDNIRIKIIKNNNKIETLKDKFKFKPFCFDSIKIAKLLKKEGYKITKIDDNNILFYIEAKNMEDKDENYSSCD